MPKTLELEILETVCCFQETMLFQSKLDNKSNVKQCAETNALVYMNLHIDLDLLYCKESAEEENKLKKVL